MSFSVFLDFVHVMNMTTTTTTMTTTANNYKGYAFPSPYMLGWLAGTKHWPIADIIAHSEFPIRMDMIIEQVRVNGFYFGKELETFGKFLCALYVSRRLPDDVIARLEEVDFPFAEEGE